MVLIKRTVRFTEGELNLINKTQTEHGCSFAEAVRKIMWETWEKQGYIKCPDCKAVHKEKYCPKCGL